MSLPLGSSIAPTRVRYSILGLLCLLAMITYLDRAMYGSAKGDMMRAVGHDVSDFFYVLTAFQLAYALFEIPTGWLGDRFGPRSTLIRIVLWWSLFVGLTGFAGMVFPGTEFVVIGFGLLLGMQFLFGIGEAGAFPNISKSAYNWFPAGQRGFAKGAVWMSARLAGGLTPLLWVVLTVILGLDWRQALWLFAGVAALWCLAFYLWFRNTPSEHPATNRAERDLIEAGKSKTARLAVPWGKLLTSRNLWAVCLMYTVTNFNWYFLMYYLPGAFKAEYIRSQMEQADGPLALAGGAGATGSEMLHGDLITPALLGGGPLLIGMIGCYLGGVLSDRYVRKTGDRKWGRRIFGMLGYGLAGIAYAAAALTTGGNFWIFATCLILVGLFNDLIMGPAWATTQDIGGRYSAIVGGAMNMIGNLGAALGNYITGRILKEYAGAEGQVICFTMYACVYGVGVFLWLLIDPTKPVVPDDHAKDTATA